MGIKIFGGSALCGAVVLSGASMLGPQGVLAGEDDWKFEITPYAWAKGVEGTSGGTDLDLDFWDDLADLIDSAGMISVNAEQGRWNFFYSFEYNKISDDAKIGRTLDYTIPPAGPTVPIEVGSKVKVVQKQTYMDFGAGYDLFTSDTVDFQLEAGARWFDQDLAIKLGNITVTGPGGREITLDGGQEKVGDDWWTPFLGGRMVAQVGKHWRLRARGDYGYTDSDNSFWMLEAMLDYRLNDWGAITLGYRHLDIDFDNDSDSSPYDYDMEESGPVIGFIFHL